MKRTILAFTLFGAGLVALPSGCSSSSSDGGSSGGDAGTSDKDSGVEVSGDADAACTALASAICERTSTCTPFALNAIYGDSATCQSREKASCVATLSAPSTGATASSAQTCATSFPSLSCSAFAAGTFGASCAIKAGTVAAGGACGDSSQCASTFCAISATSNCGTCSAVTNAGDSCVNGSCSAGLVCNTTSGKCAAPGTGQAGAACTDDSQCDLAHGVGCNTTNSQCITLTVATGVGAACGADSATPTTFAVCPASGSCSGVLKGTCNASAADGASCGGASGATCVAPARCVSGSCELPTPSSCN